MDILFRKATVLDGSGAMRRTADVLVQGSRIAAVQAQIAEGAARVIDAAGLLLAPGFIDVHSHSDISLLHSPSADAKIFQGITSEVVGNCGFAPFPLRRDPAFVARRRSSLSFIDVAETDWNWSSQAEYRKALERRGVNVNLALLAGHGSIRAMFMGYDNRPPTAAELQAMTECLDQSLGEGAAGLSVGLGYAPDFYAAKEELTAMARVVARHGKIMAFHIRGERQTLFAAVEEALDIARASSAKVHISHLKCAGKSNAGASERLLERIERARAAGADLSFDMYPYVAGSSYLGLVFPPWAHEGGHAALMARLDHPPSLAQILKEMEEGCEGWSAQISEYQGTNLVISSATNNPDCVGLSLNEIGARWGCSPAEAAVRLTREEEGQAEMILFLCQEADMDRIARHPLCMYGTDGLAMSSQNPVRSRPHPRSYAGIATLFTRYADSLGWEELVHRLTARAAERFGLKGRGLVREGWQADLALLAPKGYRGEASFEQPHVPARGVEYLMVNGQLVIDGGQPTQACAGQVLGIS